MSNLLKAGDSEPEQPLREGWLVKQSGGSAGTGRRRSVGELMKKWDERYFVLTTARLYYFKTMEDFKRGNDPSGIIPIKDHVVEPTPSNCEFMYVPAFAPQLPNSNSAECATHTLSLAGAPSLRGIDRTYRFKADDEGMAHRWITALRAVQVSCKLGNQIGFRPNSHTART